MKTNCWGCGSDFYVDASSLEKDLTGDAPLTCRKCGGVQGATRLMGEITTANRRAEGYGQWPTRDLRLWSLLHRRLLARRPLPPTSAA